MPLFIPIAKKSFPPFGTKAVNKAQLYNLDNDEYIALQFNPTSFEWERNHTWANLSWVGDSKGGDLQYLSTGPRTIEIGMLFIADPGAPDINYNSQFKIVPSDAKMDFLSLRDTIETWEKPLDNKGRPSRIRLIVGLNYFDCVIKRSHFKITEFFRSLAAREAIITLELQEWQLQKNT